MQELENVILSSNAVTYQYRAYFLRFTLNQNGTWISEIRADPKYLTERQSRMACFQKWLIVEDDHGCTEIYETFSQAVEAAIVEVHYMEICRPLLFVLNKLLSKGRLTDINDHQALYDSIRKGARATLK